MLVWPPMNLNFLACSVHSWSVFPITIYPWTQGDKEEIGRGNFSNIKISATSTDSSYLTVMGIPV